MTPGDLVRIYRRMREYGLNDPHSGNASIRLGRRVWITPHGAWAEELIESELVVVDLDSEIPAGASLDAPLHCATYREQGTHGAVLHGHGLYSVAVSLQGAASFEPLDFEGQLSFPRVPIVDASRETPFEDAARAVSRALRDHPLAIVRGHGVYSAAGSLEEAWHHLAALEWSAELAWLCRTDPRHGGR
jgi:L-fuculose-phosphate aldolase